MKVEEIKNAGTTQEDSSKEAAPYEGPERVALIDGQVRLLDEQGNALDHFAGDEEDADTTEDQERNQGADDSKETDPKKGEESTPDKGQAVYTPEEIRATDFEKLDPSRIPPELAPWYKSMQAGFTRKTQELAESAKAVREMADQIKKAPAEAQPPQIDAKEFYARKDAFLRGQVAGLFGIEPATLPENSNEWPDAMRLAYRDADERLNAEAKAAYDAKQQTVTQQQTAQAILAEFRSLDPEAYAYIQAKVDGGEISVKDEKALTAALLKGDRETVKRYYDQYKTEYLAQKHGIKTGERPSAKVVPVKVEGSGTGNRTEEKGKTDYAELGKLKTFDEKLAWMRKHNIRP